MATYATFKHVELHKVGFGKNRVPNAPRGCIGEIFNDGKQGGSKSSNCPDTPSRPRDTHSRLFGTAAPHSGAVRDNLRSNITFGSDRPGSSSSNGSNGNHHMHGENSQTNGHHGYTNGHSVSPAKEAGNPITGDGYKSLNGEINTSVTALQGSPTPILHNKVPPGGFSSGLW